MTSGIALGHVWTTTVLQDGGHTPAKSLTERFISSVFGNGHQCYETCYDQLRPVKTGCLLTSITGPYRALKVRAHQGHVLKSRFNKDFLTILCRIAKERLSRLRSSSGILVWCAWRLLRTTVSYSVESLLQFSEPRHFKFSCQNCNKLLRNATCWMKWCFGWLKLWATSSIFHYL